MLREETFTAGNLRLSYGLGPEHGPPMLLCHGVLRGWQDFNLLLPALTSRWQLHGLDFRGHGGSGWASGAYRVMDFASDAVALLRRLEDPAVIYGHSLGALVACAAAAAEPERVRGVVLEDPPFEVLGPRIAESSFHPLFTGLRTARLTATGSVRELTAALAEIRVPTATGHARLGDLRDGTQLRFSARCLLHLDPEVFDPLLAGEWLNGYDVEATLRRVLCPALLLVGSTSRGGMLECVTAEWASELMGECIRVEVPEGGHLLHWTHTEDVLRLLGGFLESLR